MKILAIDPATKCGYAHNIGKSVKSGVWDFKNGHFDGAGMHLIKFEKELRPLIERVDLVAYEGVMAHRGNSCQCHGVTSARKIGNPEAVIRICVRGLLGRGGCGSLSLSQECAGAEGKQGYHSKRFGIDSARDSGDRRRQRRGHHGQR